MKLVWTAGLKPEERKRFENEILGSKRVLNRLSDIIGDLDAEVTDKEISVTAYDNPSWAFKQAHTNGTKAAYKKILDLINLDQTGN